MVVHEGEYREWVQPKRGGISDQRRITYEAAAGEHVAIKGSERVTRVGAGGGHGLAGVAAEHAVRRLQPVRRGGRRATGPCTATGRPSPPHLGDVYLNGRSFYEVHDSRRAGGPAAADHDASTTGPALVDHVRDPDQTRYVWYAEVGADATTIWANFQGADPNAELVEINVRRSVFYPIEHHLDYITVRGFELAQAAAPWTPADRRPAGPDRPQLGQGLDHRGQRHPRREVLGDLAGQGGVDRGQLRRRSRGDKPGYQYQLESVFSAQQIGWDTRARRLARRAPQHDLRLRPERHRRAPGLRVLDHRGQPHPPHRAASTSSTATRSAASSCTPPSTSTIRHNRIHDCTLGTWLDWQTQGTRVSRNLYYRNSRDLFVEVSPRPLPGRPQRPRLARVAGDLQPGRRVRPQPGARARSRLEPVLDRPTPYHVPHSTQVGRVRGDPRRRRPLRRQRLPRW